MERRFESVKLSRPIEVDGAKVSKVRLREPMAGELRGINLLEVFQMNIDAMTVLIPRISEPHLSGEAIAALPASDLAELVARVALFFTGTETPSPSRAASKT